MTPRELEEFRELRATVRERGTARIWVFLGGMIGWGALTIATASLAALPIATFLPLLILATTFEAVFSLHVTVERIGRYIQVFLEDDESRRGWEHVAMAVGPPLKGTGADPLFTVYFLIATILNTVPALLAQPVPLEVGVVLGAHLIVAVRILVARGVASRQRAADLKRFKDLKSGGSGGSGGSGESGGAGRSDS
jgi:hypothetical protein